MLFDLQSRNRRAFVKVIYLGLAILLGGGLILFGIGTGTGGGGLFDIFTGKGSSTSAQVSSAEKRADREVRLHPQDAKAWADLVQARYQTAGLGDNYDATANQNTGGFTAKGRAKLATVASAWQRYLTLNPNHPDPALARFMVTAYGETGLADPAQATSAMEIVTEAQPTAANYGVLAQLAYVAGQLRKGDLASQKAVELAPDAQRRLVREQLLVMRRRAERQAATDALQRAGAGAATSGGTQGAG